MNRLALKFFLIVPFAVPAFADTFVFNTPANTDLGATHDFTFGTATIHAAGFDANSTTGHLYSKAGGGDEDGLGLVDDPNGANEIWFKSTGTQDFIQLDLADLISKGYTSFTFQMGSTTTSTTTGTEGWSVSACPTGGIDCGTSAVTGTDELTSHSAPASLSATNHFLDFSTTAGTACTATVLTCANTLLHSLSATPGAGIPPPVPEPTSVVLLGTALLFAGKFFRAKLAA
jgi:hypothetical protein